MKTHDVLISFCIPILGSTVAALLTAAENTKFSGKSGNVITVEALVHSVRINISCVVFCLEHFRIVWN